MRTAASPSVRFNNYNQVLFWDISGYNCNTNKLNEYLTNIIHNRLYSKVIRKSNIWQFAIFKHKYIYP